MLIKVSLEIEVLGHTQNDDIEQLRETLLDIVVGQANNNPEIFVLQPVEA